MLTYIYRYAALLHRTLYTHTENKRRSSRELVARRYVRDQTPFVCDINGAETVICLPSQRNRAEIHARPIAEH